MGMDESVMWRRYVLGKIVAGEQPKHLNDLGCATALRELAEEGCIKVENGKWIATVSGVMLTGSILAAITIWEMKREE